jgi:hypothetical protein
MTMVGDNVEVIGVDDNSTLRRDVAFIRHWRDAATVVVHFHPNSSCHHPVLRGRLSGPSLASIEWNNRTVANNRTTELTGRYHVPTSGLHYIEIIVLLCEEWTYDTDFQDICLEDPRYHRLTALNASITALQRSGSGSQEPSDMVGQWHWHDSAEGGESLSSSIVPLYTRWQRKTCGPNATDYCAEEGSLDRFRPYTFTWREESSVTPANIFAAYTRAGTRLCYVGSSHAKQLLESSQKLIPAETVTNFYAQYPHNVTAQVVQSMLDNFGCNRIVIGIGQWYGSFF